MKIQPDVLVKVMEYVMPDGVAVAEKAFVFNI